MKDPHAKRLMDDLITAPQHSRLPDFEQLWTRARLEEEFEARRRLASQIGWLRTAHQSALALLFAATVSWLSLQL